MATAARANSRGMSGHQLPNRGKTNEWLTPPWVLRALGPFTLDPCAPAAFPDRCPDGKPWPRAQRCYTAADDGLSCYWMGRVWVNPPYGDEAARWLEKLAQHAAKGPPNGGTALVFARTETQMFVDHVWPHAHGILFIASRLHFHRPDGARAAFNSGAPSVLIGYGRPDATRLAMAADRGTIPGRYVHLR